MMEILSGENMIKCRERGGVDVIIYPPRDRGGGDLWMTCGCGGRVIRILVSRWAMCGLLHDQIDIVNECVSPSI